MLWSDYTTSVKVDGGEACVNVPTVGKLFCEDFYKAKKENETLVEVPEAEHVHLELVLGIVVVLLVFGLCILDLSTTRRTYKACVLIADWMELRVEYEKKRRLHHQVPTTVQC